MAHVALYLSHLGDKENGSHIICKNLLLDVSSQACGTWD